MIASLHKHKLVSLLVEKNGEDPPDSSNIQEYSGNLSTIPATTAAINHLTIPYLKSVLLYHKVSTIGCKEQLVLRVYPLRANRSAEIVAREEQLKDLIRIAISTQRQLSFSSHIYRRRKYSITTACSKFISQPSPSHVCSDEDLTSLFKPLLDYLDRKRKAREQIDRFISMPVREKKLE